MKKEKLFQGLNAFLSFLLWMLIFGFLVRMFEAALLGYYHEEFWKNLGLCVLGFGYDILFFSKLSLVLCPIYLLIHHFSAKAAKWTFRIMGTVMLLISNAMIMYYMSAYIPLDKVFFDYSVKELIYISQSTGAFVWWGYVGLLLIPILFFMFYGFRKNTNCKLSTANCQLPTANCQLPTANCQLLLWLVLAAIGLFVWKVPSWMYSSHEDMNTVCNKQEFFWKSLVQKDGGFDRFNQKDLDRQRDRIEAFQAMFPEDEFVDYRYPFAHIDKSPDVLSQYFDLNPEQKPNFVFIVTEGLSREFSGYNSKLPSATPFLDSLADQSLYWLNCMSSSQRTIGVMPSMFGSLPFGKRGFMQSSNCPRFHSLVGILKDNGYVPSFFYGGWLCFDDMCYFLNDLGIENYLPDHSTYPKEIQNTWGLLDEALFTEGLNQVKTHNPSPLTLNPSPRLDIYLTLTTHDPFDYPKKEQYTAKYIEKLEKHHQKDEVQPSQYEQYASYFYYDDCLRQFFKEYQQLPEYENTIFVITGDHCFNAQSEELDKYHVPLIVWSPMLKEAHRFPALVAHRDVTPTFLAMMKHSYGIAAPEVVSWINTGLDTSTTFRSNTFTPQLKNSRMMDNMVYKDYFYDEGNIYQFGYENDRLTITPVENQRIKDLMGEYRAMDDYVMNNDALIMLDEDKQLVMMQVDSTQKVNYVLLATHVTPMDTMERQNVFKFEYTYPFNLFKVPLSDSLQSAIVYCDFDIFISRLENGGDKITLGLALEHADGSRDVIKTLMINYDWYEYYDSWQHYSMTQSINKAQVHYTDGDQLMCYFVNDGQVTFFVTDFDLKIVGIKE